MKFYGIVGNVEYSRGCPGHTSYRVPVKDRELHIMPVVLVLFAVALIVTFAGLYLSPRSQARRPQNDYLITPKGRRIVEATPPTPRISRVVEIAGADLVQKPLKLRASSLTGSIARRPDMTNRAVASVVYPDLWERMTSWKIAIPTLIVIFLLAFSLLNMLLPHPLLWTPAFFGTNNAQPTSVPTTPPIYAASQRLERLGQLDPVEYGSMQEYNTWAYSACSAASMTEVINSYGHKYRITDILTVESRIHEITPQLGLLEESGIQHTGAQFGFKTTWGHNLSLDQVIATANKGTPVIVSFPPARYAGGHILVVRGGDANNVYLADSSRLNWMQVSRQRFLQLWAGFFAIMTPA